MLKYKKKDIKAKKNTAKHPRVILIGPLPPPVNGQNVAFEMTVKTFEKNKLPFVVVDIADRTGNRADGQFTWSRAGEIIQSIASYFRYVWQSGQIVYLTIAQTRMGFLRDIIFVWVGCFFKHRIVIHLYGGGYLGFYQAQSDIFKSLIVKTIQRASRLIVEGDYLRNQFDFLSEADSFIGVVHNTLPEGLQVPQKSHIRQPDDPFRVLYLSNLVETKGYWNILEAVQILRKKGLNIQADFCGAFLSASDDTKYSDAVSAQKDFENVLTEPVFGGMVRYRGLVSGNQKEKLLAQADVFVLPSYYVNEGQPISVIEAIAYGIPVISTRYRGIPEMVEDGINGYIVSPRSPADIAARIEQLYKSPELCANMRQASQQIFSTSFDQVTTSAKLLREIFGYEFIANKS